MSDGNNIKKSKKSIEQKNSYEELVEKVYRCYYLLNCQKKEFYMKRNYKVSDLKNADYYFSKAKNKKKLDNMKNTELADVYFSYTSDNNEKIETYIECKSGNFQKKEIEKECITKLDKFGIKNVNKILVFREKEELKDDVKEFCSEHNIELINIVDLIKCIDLTIQASQYRLTGVKPYPDEEWCMKNNIPIGKELQLCVKGIKINNEEHIFHGDLNWLSANGFEKSIIEVDKTISYSRNEENDILYIIVDCHNNDVVNNLRKIKLKKLELFFSIINYPPIRQLIKVDNDDSFAQIENIFNGKKEIVFESGKIKEKV